MPSATLEHVNITVRDPLKTAQRLCDWFGWTIRWQGKAIHGGFTVHVGNDFDYLALYTLDAEKTAEGPDNYRMRAALNHIGLVVDDLAAAERCVIDAGYQTHSHADYEPGRRFYFIDEDGVEFEIISYA